MRSNSESAMGRDAVNDVFIRPIGLVRINIKSGIRINVRSWK